MRILLAASPVLALALLSGTALRFERLEPPAGASAADLAAAERVGELEEGGAAGRARRLLKLIEVDDPRCNVVLAMRIDADVAELLHEERCDRPHLGEAPTFDPISSTGILCGLADRAFGFSDQLVIWGCWRQMHIREEALLSKVRSGDEAARYTALAVLFRCRAVTPVVDVVEALQKAPVDRLLWLRPVLHQVLRETSWPSIREAVSRGDPWALGVCAARRHPEAVEVLIRLLDPGRTDSSQVDAAWVLGRLGDRRAVPALVRQLRHGTCASAAEAAEALGLIGDPEALPALRDAAVQEGNWPQPDAFKALGRLGEWEDLSLMEHLAGNTEGRWNSEAGVALSVLVERLRATVR